jgi:hypothetical protein
MPIVQRLAPSLPGPLAAGLGVGEVVLYRSLGLAIALIPIGAIAASAAILYRVGRRRFPNHPKSASYLLEAGLCLQFILAIVGSGVALGVTIQFTPADTATTATKAIWAATVAAIVSFLGIAFVNPTGKRWNPVKARVEAEFSAKFPEKTEDAHVKDARDAVYVDNFAGQVRGHKYVAGWGWSARHVRALYIQEGLDHLAGGRATQVAAINAGPES